VIYKIRNKAKGTLVAQRGVVANSFFQRLLGFMFRKNIKEEEALIFYHAPSIHTFFMFTPIDVIFLDKRMTIIDIRVSLKPWRIVSCINSYITIELSPRQVIRSLTDRGDVLEFISSTED
jgi:hypothetical protein